MSGVLNLKINRGTTFGPIVITAKDKATGLPLPLAGYKAYSQIRKDENDPEIYYDLSPIIASDDTAGIIIIPALTPEITAFLAPFTGKWDVILEDPDGIRLTDPIVQGNVSVSLLVTKP